MNRRNLWFLLPLVLGLVLTQAAFAPDASAVYIIDLHNNTSAGVPAAPYTIGTQVTVSGIVTVPDSVFNTYSTDCYIQDETGGIDIYVSGGLNSGLHFKLGDSVTITSNIAQFNGLTEISSAYELVTLVTHATGRPVPEPLVLTCAQVNATFNPTTYAEPNESRLIRINGVTLVSGSWPVTPSGSNVTLQINDGTATTILFIDKDCGANGTPQPVGYFDIIGVLKQYDTSSPYTTGYEICPRFASDVVYWGNGPLITSGPEEDDLTTSSATISWTTNTASTSTVEYGTTISYGSVVEDTDLVTDHEMPLSSLSANTLYHYRVSSTDVSGTRTSGDHVFVTVSDVASEFHIYFNKSVETSYNKGTLALGNQNVQQKLIDRIDAATYSIDCCFYSFSLSSVADALIAAKGRGVSVRFIIEADNVGYEANRLAANGIPVIASTYGGNHGAGQGYGSMHNKFVVFDCQPATSKTDDWVWTSSWNCSISGNDDANNILAVKDYGLASAYKLEFNEMWGSDTATPNATEAKMGSRKADNTPHKFIINGMPTQQYMSPSDRTESRMIEAVGTADSTIYFCILSFTSNELSAAMKSKWVGIPGFQVRGVFEGSSVGPITSGSEWYAMSGDPTAYNYWSPPADVYQDGLPSSYLLHHTYMIIDSSWPTMDPTVVTGSHNWSYSANTVNDENTLVVHDAIVANVYLQEFAARYHEAGGSGSILISVDGTPGIPADIAALEVFPNPFNPALNVRYVLSADGPVSIRIFDVSGRAVRTLLDNHRELAGFHSIMWDGKDSSGGEVASGIYVLRLETENDARAEKAILLR
ncbi:MAG: phospholipase D-like domain-containing protein [Candidatus Eisenbacteria bacterium]